jgi:type II secretory ATPase GspE/PulE/Tfp pilus assembly ATPase PilB-like protein
MTATGLLESILIQSLEIGASDVHLRHERDRLQVRMRIDGMLQDTHTISASLQDAILARLKILAGLRTDEHVKPQDGRFRFESVLGTIDIRVAIAPGYHGENAVLRLLETDAKARTLRSLGCRHTHELMLTRALERSQGLVLATGPTGSGKTTLLYTLIGMLDRTTRAIVTLEDPVEYSLPGVHQIPVSSGHGMTFATGLRSVLRQDPDVIMVGEVRDGETASIAANAALTGHLVLSTLHTNDAASAVVRLTELGVDPYLIASTLQCVIAQRLVRRICRACREPDRPEERMLENIRPFIESTLSGTETFYRGRGCDECRSTGYQGRIGTFEILRVDEPIKEAILAHTGLDIIRSAARSRGMRTLAEDGLEKARRGVTTIEELNRVSYA